MYDKERKITINFKNGLSKTITPIKGGDSFLDIEQAERDNISSLRFVLGDQTFTISKKINKDLETSGFFYHIMEGRKVILGDISGLDNPLLRERIGFCYGNNGVSSAILIDYIKGNVEFIDENLLLLGVNIELFHDLKDKKAIFYQELTAFRNALLRARESNEPSSMMFPMIPYMPVDGQAPRVLFNSKDVTDYKP